MGHALEVVDGTASQGGHQDTISDLLVECLKTSVASVEPDHQNGVTRPIGVDAHLEIPLVADIGSLEFGPSAVGVDLTPGDDHELVAESFHHVKLV